MLYCEVGGKYYGKTVTVVGDLMPEEDRLRTWAEGICCYLY